MRVEEVVTVVEKPVVREVIKEVERVVPYISETVKEVKVKVTEPAVQTVERFTEVPTIIEKVVAVNNEIPRVYEV